MKKGVVITGLFLLVLVFFVIGASALTQSEKVDKAYKCLNDKIDAKGCSKLSTEELIFTVLSTGNCRDEFLRDSHNLECWPGGNCNVELTAKALLVLDKLGEDKSAAQDWLLSRTATSRDLNWFLEIDNDGPVSTAMQCKIYYDGELAKTVNVGKDKKFDQNAGSCLTLSNNNYWYKVSKSCYDVEFGVSCDKGFKATFLFQKDGSRTYHITDNVVGKAATGTEILKISSKCFANSPTQCDYVGSLWAASILDATASDSEQIIKAAKSFKSYLVAGMEEHSQYLPEAFLFMLTSNSAYKNALMLKQFGDKYWNYFRGKYYSTALAMLPFIGRQLQEREGAINWLMESQETSGCWDAGIITNNAFVLWTLFPREINLAQYECLDEGFRCQIENDTCQGTIMDLGCAGTEVCCDPTPVIRPAEDTCTPNGVNFNCVEESSCTGIVNDTFTCVTEGEVCCDTEPSLENTCTPQEGFGCVENSQTCSLFGGTVDSTFVCDNNYVCCNTGDGDSNTCADNGGTCLTIGSATCNNVLDYTCDVGEFCCDVPDSSETCAEANFECLPDGTACSSPKSQYDCSDGEFCCNTQPTPNVCEQNSYACVSDASLCEPGRIVNGLPCGDSTDYCCTGEVYHDKDTCTPIGYSCETDETSCTDQGGTLEDGFYCKQGNVCCNIPEEADTCTPEGYTCLESGETCNGMELSDPFTCPNNGVCCYEGFSNETALCTDQGNTCVANASQCGEGLVVDQFYCLGSQVCCTTDIIPDESCTDAGFSCVDSYSCSGDILSGYDCSDGKVCCDSTTGYSCEEDGGYTCSSQTTCSAFNGIIINSYNCEGALKCCSQPETKDTCEDLGGIVCSSNQECSGGVSLITTGINPGQSCCTQGGTCEQKKVNPPSPTPVKKDDCEDNFGVCESGFCDEGYEETNSYSCENSANVCCIKTESNKKSYWWVWVLFILIILVVIAIIYRDKLKEYYQKLQIKLSGAKNNPSSMNRRIPPRFPPRRNQIPPRTLSSKYRKSPQMSPPQPRKIIPNTSIQRSSNIPPKAPLQKRPFPPRPQQKPIVPKKKSPKELEDVLKKLKEMGK